MAVPGVTVVPPTLAQAPRPDQLLITTGASATFSRPGRSLGSHNREKALPPQGIAFIDRMLSPRGHTVRENFRRDAEAMASAGGGP
jgi:hypothetical protein